ncbi:hypothetical protein M2352_000927 [Azospirillum fermentarium]|uniref:hypothetical protein n=1 Tax=Azospirillum fermentarium TaxID=1233114 RepID=UPI0022266CBD|nr:hypothetical protein [Azospirillum fermentarium]MCW2245336.1 hypothetical protein [Azospirillum fermentarium]
MTRSFLDTLPPLDPWRPATFEAAGVPLPLDVPGLAGARVRPAGGGAGAGGLEVVVPGWSGGAGVLVLAWPSLPVLGQMNAAGRALHRDVARMDNPTPERIRLAAAVLALTAPVTGPGRPFYTAAARAAARRRVTRAAMGEVTVRYALMMRLLRAGGVAPFQLDPAPDLESVAGRALVRDAFEALGRRLALEPGTVHDRALRLGSLLQPLGFPARGEEGRLRRQMAVVEEVWREAAAGSFGPLSALVEGSAAATLGRARRLLVDLDRDLADPVGLLAAWGPRALSLRRGLDRLGWLLDGWEDIRAPWGEEEGDTPPRTPAALLARLPLLPRTAEPDRGPAFSAAPSRRVGACRDWRTGRLDEELARRMGYPIPDDPPSARPADTPGEPLFPGTVQ